jgi:hypothetical protein
MLFTMVAAMTIALFWREMGDYAAEDLSAVWSTSVEQEAMRSGDFLHIKEVRFEREHNNLSLIQVDDLKIADRSESAVTLSLRIINKASDNDFPGLRVTIFSGTGAKLRSIEFGPLDYPHGSSFSDETVQLHIEIKPGDARFSVSAFYQD